MIQDGSWVLGTTDVQGAVIIYGWGLIQLGDFEARKRAGGGQNFNASGKRAGQFQWARVSKTRQPPPINYDRSLIGLADLKRLSTLHSVTGCISAAQIYPWHGRSSESILHTCITDRMQIHRFSAEVKDGQKLVHCSTWILLRRLIANVYRVQSSCLHCYTKNPIAGEHSEYFSNKYSSFSCD